MDHQQYNWFLLNIVDTNSYTHRKNSFNKTSRNSYFPDVSGNTIWIVQQILISEQPTQKLTTSATFIYNLKYILLTSKKARAPFLEVLSFYNSYLFA